MRCASADLRDARFEHCIGFDPDQERGIDFTFANLREAAFAHCDFTAGEFANITGYGLTLEHCQLGGASFAGADFRRTIDPLLRCWECGPDEVPESPRYRRGVRGCEGPSSIDPETD